VSDRSDDRRWLDWPDADGGWWMSAPGVRARLVDAVNFSDSGEVEFMLGGDWWDRIAVTDDVIWSGAKFTPLLEQPPHYPKS
jgi:hypothetical protein